MATSFLTVTPLQQGERVIDWAELYKAQTATLEDSQRRGLLPAYVARTQGERILAAEAAGLNSLEEALSSLVKSIDGECREVESFVAFINQDPPEGEERADWLTFLVKQLDEAKKAGFGSKVVIMRLLSLIENGQVAFGKLKGKVKDGMTTADLVALLDHEALKGKLKRVQTRGSLHQRSEPHEEAFEFYEQEESECLLICFGCNKKGHIQRNCKARCPRCGKVGHTGEKCYKKGKQAGQR